MMSPPPDGLPSSVGVGSSVALSVGESVNPPEPMLPTDVGDDVASEPGTRDVNGDLASWPFGAELPGPPSDCGARRVPASPPGWMTLSFGTGSGSKATPAMPPSAPTATVAAVIRPITLSRLLLKYSSEDRTGPGVGCGVVTWHPRPAPAARRPRRVAAPGCPAARRPRRPGRRPSPWPTWPAASSSG